MLDLLCAILREGPFQWPDTFQAECGALGASEARPSVGFQGPTRGANAGGIRQLSNRGAKAGGLCQLIDEAGAVRLYDVAREHGVHLLVAERVWQRGELNDSPPALRDRLVAALRNQLAVEEIARQELRSVLATLDEAGIVPLLFKGTALAFTHYQDPALRPRFDTDVLIDTSEIQSAGATLERLGYRRSPFTSGDLVMYQAPYSRTDRRGVRHTIDVHWRVSNPQVFVVYLAICPRSARLVAHGTAPRPEIGEDPARNVALKQQHATENLLRLHGRITCGFCIAAQHESHDGVAIVVDLHNPVSDGSLLVAIEKNIAWPYCCRLYDLHGDCFAVPNGRAHARTVRPKPDTIASR